MRCVVGSSIKRLDARISRSRVTHGGAASSMASRTAHDLLLGGETDGVAYLPNRMASSAASMSATAARTISSISQASLAGSTWPWRSGAPVHTKPRPLARLDGMPMPRSRMHSMKMKSTFSWSSGSLLPAELGPSVLEWPGDPRRDLVSYPLMTSSVASPTDPGTSTGAPEKRAGDNKQLRRSRGEGGRVSR